LLITLVSVIGWITAKEDTPILTIDQLAFLTKHPTVTISPDKITSPLKSEPDGKQTDTNVKKDETPEIKVHFIDVGQADCILIESEGKFMLVDGGNNEDDEIILDYLSEVGVTKLEYIIATHPHEDHIGALDRVVETYEATKIFAPHKEHTSKTYTDFLEACILKNHTLKQPKVGSEVMLGRCTVTFLAPNKDYGDELNNWSIGLKVTNGVHTFVMCGDAEEEAEEDILANGIDLDADVLKLGHHGSSTSTSDAFLKAVSPKYAVISVGEGNTYGHPHKETLTKLKEEGILFFRTDEQGTIIATSDGKEITWNVEPYK
jgi:beta-lactamase superfamily II metal-dependent hydrolase